MSLTDAPAEILQYIAEFILFESDARRLYCLVATCRYTYAVLHHLLYRSITCHTDTAGAKCSKTLANSDELCELVQSFTVYGPDRMHSNSEDRREFIRDLARALQKMPNLRTLNCDVSYCSLEVCIALSTGSFEQLEFLALRITDQSIPISRSVHQLGDLEPGLPRLTHLLVRDNTQPSYAQRFIEHFIGYRRDQLTEVMLSCWYDSGNKYLQCPCDIPSWSSLYTLTIRRDAVNMTILSLIPQVRRLTLLRDLRPMPPLPAHVLPNLQYIACATFNLGSFLQKGKAGSGRPISKIKLDSVSATGIYHGPSSQPTRTSLRSALSHLAFSAAPIEHLAFPIRMLYAAYFSDVAPYLQEAKSLVVHIVIRAHVQTGERRQPTNTMSIRELGQRIVQLIPRLQTLLMPNAVIPCRNDEPVASEEEKILRHKAILHEWTIICPTLERAALGKDYLWEKGIDGWVRRDAIYEHDYHELRYFDY